MTYVGLGAVMVWLTVFPLLLAVLGLFQVRRARVSGVILLAVGVVSVLVCVDAWMSEAVLNRLGPDVKRAVYLVAFLVQALAMVQRALVISWGGRTRPDAGSVALAEKAVAATVWIVLILLLLSLPSLLAFGKGLGQI